MQFSAIIEELLIVGNYEPPYIILILPYTQETFWVYAVVTPSFIEEQSNLSLGVSVFNSGPIPNDIPNLGISQSVMIHN